MKMRIYSSESGGRASEHFKAGLPDSIQLGRRSGGRRAVHFEMGALRGCNGDGGGGGGGVIAFLTCPIKLPFRLLSAVSAYAAPKWPGDYGK